MKAAADPFAYDRYRKERVTALREEAASSRIRATKKKVVKRSDLQPALEAAAADSRFGDLLTDPAFSIDTRSETFKRLNPMGVRTTPKVTHAQHTTHTTHAHREHVHMTRRATSTHAVATVL
jgi:hypothetical protein